MINDNFLFSFCFNLENKDLNKCFEILKKTSKDIKEDYKFYEIIIILDEKTYSLILNQKERKKISNLRFIVLKEYANDYKRRSICAFEAIGDIILISSFDEINYFDIHEMISKSIYNEKIVIGFRSNHNFFQKLLFYSLKFIGYLADLDINQNLSKTIVLPRADLNLILEDNYVDLKLRFPPSNRYLVSFDNQEANRGTQKNQNFRGKISILYMSLLNLTPILMQFLTIFAGITIITSIFYFFYIILIWIFMNEIQTGWITMSLSVTGVSFFLSSSIFILSIGLQHIIKKLNNKKSESLYEIKEIDIFEKVKHDLNVDTSKKNE